MLYLKELRSTLKADGKVVYLDESGFMLRLTALKVGQIEDKNCMVSIRVIPEGRINLITGKYGKQLLTLAYLKVLPMPSSSING